MIIIAYAYISGELRKDKISENHIVVCAEILKLNSVAKNPTIDYTYSFNGKKYKNHIGCKYHTVDSFFSGQNILNAIEKVNPGNSALLEDNEDYIRLKIVINDTAGVKCNN